MGRIPFKKLEEGGLGGVAVAVGGVGRVGGGEEGGVNLLWTEIVVAFVKHFQGLRRLRSEGRPTRQTLEHDCSKAPKIRFGVVLQRHDHLRRLCKQNKQTATKAVFTAG